jgi:hypothetical protein
MQLCYGTLLALTVAANYVPIPVYVHMMISTMVIIYIGSHYSVAEEHQAHDVSLFILL